MPRQAEWGELLYWVKQPERTNDELREACVQLELPNPYRGNRMQKRRKLQDFIQQHPRYDPATWTPEGMFPEVSKLQITRELLEELKGCLPAIMVLFGPFVLVGLVAGFILGRVSKRTR
jgi:hypothetical protein